MNWWPLRAKVHVSWLIATACLGVVIGAVAVPSVTRGLFYSYVWLILSLALLMIGFWRSRRYCLVLMLVAGCLLGLWRGSVGLADLEPYRLLIGQTITIKGSVLEDADIGKKGDLVLRMGRLQVEGHDLSGSLWVSTATKFDIKRSDIVTIRGELGDGFGSFSASMYRASTVEVQRPQPGDIARQVRDGFADNVRTAIPEPQASLGIGYLVGQRRALPDDLSQALRIAGLTHVIVASGYNLTILVRLARRLFVKISKYLAALSASVMIVAFIAVTGLSPSMSRAGLVAGLSLLAWYYGRKFHPLVLLPVAAATTLLINPSYGWNDLGWQLSFAAFGGVMILAPLIQRYLFGDKPPGLVRQILGETISAQIATLPIIIAAFGVFSNVAVIANILILPLVPLAMLLTFVAGLGGLIVPSLAEFAGLPATWLLQYMTATAQYFSQLPWAQTELSIGLVFIVLYYAVLAVICLYIARVTKFKLREVNIVE